MNTKNQSSEQKKDQSSRKEVQHWVFNAQTRKMPFSERTHRIFNISAKTEKKKKKKREEA